MGTVVTTLLTANDKMKVIFVFALFFASALCDKPELFGETKVVGPADIVHAYTKFGENSAHASVKAQAPKREAKHIELTKAQSEEMLALCKAGKDIDFGAFGITPPEPISVSATASASFKHVVPHPIVHKIVPAPIAC